jgi:apolipoprotein N-acyltransferase
MRSIPARLWVLTLVSAVLQLLPFPIAGPAPLWRRLFCWICLVPLLCALLSVDRKEMPLRPLLTALLGYVCGIAWYLGNCYWIYQTMHIYGNIPAPVSVGILFLFALYLGLYLALFGWVLGFLRAKYSVRVSLIATPFVWVAVELARARITGFPWDLLGYTQVENPVLAGVAPLGGVMLLSFVIAAVGAVFAAAFFAATTRMRWGVLGGALLAALVLQAGAFYHPASDPASRSAVLLQENLRVGADDRDLVPLPMAEKYRQFIGWSRSPLAHDNRAASTTHWSAASASEKHDLIVWPEAPAHFATSDPEFGKEVSSLARGARTAVIAGTLGVDFDDAAEDGYRAYGSAVVYRDDGSYAGRYDKIHRVPWGEYVPYKKLFFFAGSLVAGVGNMQPGTQHSVFPLDGHKVGIFICYESIFGDEVRQFTKNGAEVLVNISDDGWYGDSGAPWQHLDMARMRAIENRRWVLRDTNTGVTTSIDPHGRLIFAAPRHVRAAFVLPFDYVSGTTFYTRHGDWFAWICGVVVAVLLGFSFRRRSLVN